MVGDPVGMVANVALADDVEPVRRDELDDEIVDTVVGGRAAVVDGSCGVVVGGGGGGGGAGTGAH